MDHVERNARKHRRTKSKRARLRDAWRRARQFGSAILQLPGATSPEIDGTVECAVDAVLGDDELAPALSAAAARFVAATGKESYGSAKLRCLLGTLDLRHDVELAVLAVNCCRGSDAMPWTQRRALVVFDEVVRSTLTRDESKGIRRLLAPACEERLAGIPPKLHSRFWWYSYPAGTTRATVRRDTAGDVIVVVIDSLEEEYQVTLVRSIVSTAEQHGKSVVVLEAGNRQELNRGVLTQLYDRTLANKDAFGVIVVSGTINLGKEDATKFCEYVSRCHGRARSEVLTPTVSIGVAADGFASPGVEVAEAMRAAVAHLVEAHGCRRVGVIRGPADNQEDEERFRAIRESMQKLGVAPSDELVIRGDFLRESGRTAAHALLEREPGLGGIITFNDAMALGARDALGERRLLDKVAVIGFDDTDSAHITDLTTVRAPIREQGALAVKLLIDGAPSSWGNSLNAEFVARSCVHGRSCRTEAAERVRRGRPDGTYHAEHARRLVERCLHGEDTARLREALETECGKGLRPVFDCLREFSHEPRVAPLVAEAMERSDLHERRNGLERSRALARISQQLANVSENGELYSALRDHVPSLSRTAFVCRMVGEQLTRLRLESACVEGRPLIVNENEFSSQLFFPAEHRAGRAPVALVMNALRAEGRVVGYTLFDLVSHGQWPLFRELSQQLSQSLERLAFAERLRAAEYELASLNRLAPPLRRALDYCAQLARDALGADLVTIYPRFAKRVPVSGGGPAVAGPLRHPERMTGACSNDTVIRLLEHGRSVYLPDTRRVEEGAGVFLASRDPAVPGFLEREGIASVVGIVLHSECGEIIGAMFVNYRHPVDVRRLRSSILAFAQAATSAIHHARLLQMARTQTREEERRREAAAAQPN